MQGSETEKAASELQNNLQAEITSPAAAEMPSSLILQCLGPLNGKEKWGCVIHRGYVVEEFLYQFSGSNKVKNIL